MSPFPYNIPSVKSRNRRSKFKLVFNAEYEDYIDFGTGRAWIDRNEGYVSASIGNWSYQSPIIDQGGFSRDVTGWWTLSTGNPSYSVGIRAYYELDIQFANIPAYTYNDVEDSVISVNNISRKYRMYIDQTRQEDNDSAFTPANINPNIRMLVAAATGTDETTIVKYSSGTLHWFSIKNGASGDSDTFYLNEGSGNTVISDTGKVGTIKTSHPDGQAYIDNMMWRKDEESPFVFEVTITEPDKLVFLPIWNDTYTFDAKVYWGDGTSDEGGGLENTYHIYQPGTYRVEIDGIMTSFGIVEPQYDNYSIMPYITKVSQFGQTGLVYLKFQDCTELETITASDFPITITDCSYFVDGCSKLSYMNTENWRMSQVTTLAHFSRDSRAVFDVSKWDVSNCLNMEYFLMGNLGIRKLDSAKWDVSKVTNFGNFAYKARYLHTIECKDWDLSSAETMYNFGREAIALSTIDVSKWKTSNISSFQQFLYKAPSLLSLDVSNWDTSQVNTFSYAFNQTGITSLDVSNWKFNVPGTSLNGFVGASPNLNELIGCGNWDISNITVLGNFLNGSKLLTANYDSILTGWTGWNGAAATKPVPDGLSFNAGTSNYTLGSEADAARQYLIETKGWTIVDGGGI